MTEKVFCNTCGGPHEPDPADCHIDFRGFRFVQPFKCMCCGRTICAEQFAFARACGTCDVGACNSISKTFRLERAHAHPDWWSSDPAAYFAKYVKTVGATSIEG